MVSEVTTNIEFWDSDKPNVTDLILENDDERIYTDFSFLNQKESSEAPILGSVTVGATKEHIVENIVDWTELKLVNKFMQSLRKSMWWNKILQGLNS